MTIDDILTELRITHPLPDHVHRFQTPLPSQGRGRGLGLRRVLAAALVRAGIWLDRRAGERALKPTTH